MVRKIWIAVLIFAICMHLGFGIVVVDIMLHFPQSFRYPIPWSIILVVVALIVADFIALHRRIIDDNGEILLLRL